MQTAQRSFKDGPFQGHYLRERRRLRAHFRAVDAELRAADVSRMPLPLRQQRERNISLLAEYARAGAFPRNANPHGRPVPIFRDDLGTRCAVGHLLYASGDDHVVDRIAKENNHVRVAEIRSGPLLNWLESSGLTQAEAARIQPAYGGPYYAFNFVAFYWMMVASAMALNLVTGLFLLRREAATRNGWRVQLGRYGLVVLGAALGASLLGALIDLLGYGPCPGACLVWTYFEWSGPLLLLPLVAVAEGGSLLLLSKLWPRMDGTRLVGEAATLFVLSLTLCVALLGWP